jgi:hypothetical protein
MAETSRPWDGTTTGDAGPYSSADWASNWNYSLAKGASRANVGPFLDSGTIPDDGLKVQAQSPAAAAVDVLPGAALVAGRWYLSTATEGLTIAANASGNDRIDTVILRADYSLQTIVLAVLQGTPAGSPTPPTLTQTLGVLYEIPLADVLAANGFATIADTDITPRHEWANAASGLFETVLNNSGGTLTDGQVVIWDTSADRAVTTTTTYNDPLVAGVMRGRVSNGDYGLMQTRGIGLVEVAGAYARGTGLYPSTSAGEAGGLSGVSNGSLGLLLEASGGAGELVLAAINVLSRKNAVATYAQKLANTTAGPVYGSGTTVVVLNTEVSDVAGMGALASNQVTLQPGVYYATGRITVASNTNRILRATIYDATAAADVVTGDNAQTNSSTQLVIPVSGVLRVTTPTLYELHLYSSNTNAVAASAASSGAQECYATLDFVRIDQ